MMMPIRSPSLNPDHSGRRTAPEHASPSTISLLAPQITTDGSLLWFRSDHRNCSAAQSLYLSPPAAIDVARSPLKSP
jgi:hypothetical protein